MHLGAHAIIGSRKLENYKYILINNGVHESVGSQPTVALDIDIKKLKVLALKTIYLVIIKNL